MALDEPKDTDNVYDVDGFKYVVSKDLMEKAQPIKVDFLHVGFKVDSSMDFGAGCACSTSKSSCSC